MSGVDRVYRQGDVTMAYTDTRCGAAEGSVGAAQAPTFVLVHGIGMGRIVFAEVAEKLSARGRVLAVDLPGFGDSPEPGSAATLEQTAAAVLGFVREQVPGRVILVGHSMGTQIVAEMARQDPGRAAGLVLIAPTVNRYERTALRQALRMLQDLTGERPKVILLGMLEYLKTSPRWFARKLAFMLRHRLEEICPEIAMPALVLRGETDRVCPRRWVAEVAAALPRGTMQEIPGRGHEAVIRSAEPAALMILRWLDDAV